MSNVKQESPRVGQVPDLPSSKSLISLAGREPAPPTGILGWHCRIQRDRPLIAPLIGLLQLADLPADQIPLQRANVADI